MDDTELGRPARHARNGVTREAPAPVARERVVGDAVRPCGVCGAPVDLSFDGEFTRPVAGLIARQLAGELPVTCAECGARLEREMDERDAVERMLVVVESRQRAAGVPAKWSAQTFEGMDADDPRERALTLAREWAVGERRGLVLDGPVGRGKTAIAAAAANARMGRGAVRWLSVAELLMDLSAPFGSPTRERAVARLDASRGNAALVLDDLDKLKPTEHAVQPLYVAVNGWIEAELPLLVTLNRTLGGLASMLPEMFAEPIASRLAGYCAQAHVGGRDRRLS